MAWITGTGLTAFGRQPGRSHLQWQAKAARMAIQDAGIHPAEIDAVVCGYATTAEHLMPANALAEYLGLHPKVAFGMSVGGATGLAMVDEAVRLVTAGTTRCVLVVAGEDRASGQSGDKSTRMLSQIGHPSHEQPVGATVPAYYGLLASWYLHQYGGAVGELAPLATQLRAHASRCDGAHFRDPITVDDVLDSPPIAEPLRLLECCPVSDGAAAILVAIQPQDQRAIRVTGTGQAHHHQHLTEADFDTFGAKHAVDHATASAGVSLADIDVLGIYDSFTVTLALLLEEIGIVEPGTSAQHALRGDFDLRGKWPLNTHGGLLSYGHSGVAGGMAHLIEVTTQLRGEASARQVPDAPRRGLVHADGGIMSAHVSVILEAR